MKNAFWGRVKFVLAIAASSSRNLHAVVPGHLKKSVDVRENLSLNRRDLTDVSEKHSEALGVVNVLSYVD